MEARAIPWSLAMIYLWCASIREIKPLLVEGASEHWNLRYLVYLMTKVLWPWYRSLSRQSGVLW